MADHPHPPQVGRQTGVKGIKADAHRRAENDLDLRKLTIDERNRYLQSKSFQAQTHDEEYQGRAMQQVESLNRKVLGGGYERKGRRR
jgi:protein required for attachment to host cells